MTKNEFEILVRECRHELVATAQQVLAEHSVAEDVVQEALLKLWTMRERLDEYRNPKSLAYVIVRHLSLNILRERKRHPAVDLDSQRGLTNENLQDVDERYDEVLRAMDSLPSKQQIVLRLKHIERMEVDEIANIAQMSVDAVYQNLSRARRAIVEQFKNRDDR